MNCIGYVHLSVYVYIYLYTYIHIWDARQTEKIRPPELQSLMTVELWGAERMVDR